MSLMAFFDVPIPPEPGPGEGQDSPFLELPPYTGPAEDRTGVTALVAPYNAATYLDMPAHPGYPAGYGVHPSVVDMQAETGEAWKGYRYWMAWTPYPNGDVKAENPCIAVSNDKRTWAVPPGGANPIYPWTGISGDYYSDTELVWDPERRRLWCYWRESVNKEAGEIIWCGWTADGITWSPRIKLFSTDYDTGTLSPTVVRVAADHWRMFYIGDRGKPSGVRTAARPEGPWSAHTTATFTQEVGGYAQTPWHVYIRYEYGHFRGVLNARDASNTWRLFACTSTDGVNFKVAGKSPVQSPRRSQGWESQQYRTCMVPADNGIDYDVWYSDMGSGWRIGYTQWPKKHWWDLEQ